MIEIATVVQTSLKYDNSCCEGIGLGRDCKHGKGCQKEQSKMLDINIVVVCLLHYISVKCTTVEFVVP